MFFRITTILLFLGTPALAQSDGGVVDAGDADGGVVDGGFVDGGLVDSGLVDAGDGDAGAADAGEADAGPDACDPRCDGSVLRFCDGEAPSELDCLTLEARCGELSAPWGADCLLPSGAACDPGYAFGESRCDRAASLYCLDGACAVGSEPEAPAPLTPSPGTSASTSSSDSSDPFACSSCTSTSAAGLFVFAGALRRLQRKRRS